MIILMGVAGAGKSMQGRLLADEKGYSWISTGEILRVLVTGKRRQEMLEGKLLSDDEIIRLIDKILELIDVHEEFMLDGFPRTTRQAEWLIEQAKKGRFNITGVFHLAATEEVVLERLKKRGRVDDTDTAIRKRFDEYHQVTLPIIDHFKAENIPVFDINGDQDARIVHDQILKNLP
ncbi:MAG TPA: nucleoside monophosphate kinase [Candidatus Saccharibacteria bacterium]|jgi:adenylate kinase|nr:nucleoside monophosphate kinase [Candidatus Saccharibacteria bacterium]